MGRLEASVGLFQGRPINSHNADRCMRARRGPRPSDSTSLGPLLTASESAIDVANGRIPVTGSAGLEHCHTRECRGLSAPTIVALNRRT